MKYCFLYFPDYYDFANYITDGNRRILIHNDHRFYKKYDNGSFASWRCAGYIRFKCQTKAITRCIQGYDMVRLTGPIHNHQSDFLNHVKIH